MTDSAHRTVEALTAALPRLGLALGFVLAGWVLSRSLRWVLRAWFRRTRTPSFARVMSKVAGCMLFGVALLAATAAAFPSVKPVDLLAGLGFFSVAIGFAFQDILENTLSGVLLLFRQPFVTGDQIQVQEESGTVLAITIRETRIKTFDGQLVVIPNRDVYKSVIRVQTHFDDRRLTFTVGIAYENDAGRHGCGSGRARRGRRASTPNRHPRRWSPSWAPPRSSIEVRFWCASRQHEGLVVQDRAITAAKAALDAAGIEMPADIIALQATPSLAAASRTAAEVTPGGGVRTDG